ncbi:DsrE/DsrF/DrsH-like family protein [Labilibaculum antarcticum]|uniref:NADH dehydrogenase n=1 Tax=Labilibaculum antarcticum TaxID=1717717 RepID=A0A1Y1CN48_9BACT|nr:DsrE/DsrF/DrsH-like family protein [Labilibaculum antarcticum]BAX81785.1 hypothetical protein ALGA_3487 [Labilibaculum antarcticum]
MQQVTEIQAVDFQKQIDALTAKVSMLEDMNQDQLSIAVVSGDFDKILAAMVISLGAAAMDTEVKLFFSFWSIAALRDPKKSVRGKNFISKMFGIMLPKGWEHLKLSTMNMGGVGPRMIKSIMKKHGVLSLEEMFKQAGELGIEITICEMSMDLMGIKKEELIDYPNMRIAGAVTFAGDMGESSAQLFI